MSQQLTRKCILIVEQDDGIASFLRAAIQDEMLDYTLLATNSEQALDLVRQVKVDLFLLDNEISPISGIALYDHLHQLVGLESIPAIILSTNLPRYQREIERRYLTGISKPCELDDLLDTIESLLGCSSASGSSTSCSHNRTPMPA
ncbi:MAG TPA: response regulator [Ktedonobacteraceae bacterium]|nr:response regulator [Ktedonobacteraceae bacterium]